MFLESNESNLKEVSITKRKNNMVTEEFVSVFLKSNDDSIDDLIKKAMFATTYQSGILKKTTLGAIF
jgi:hypothetical protein